MNPPRQPGQGNSGCGTLEAHGAFGALLFHVAIARHWGKVLWCCPGCFSNCFGLFGFLWALEKTVPHWILCGCLESPLSWCPCAAGRVQRAAFSPAQAPPPPAPSPAFSELFHQALFIFVV